MYDTGIPVNVKALEAINDPGVSLVETNGTPVIDTAPLAPTVDPAKLILIVTSRPIFVYCPVAVRATVGSVVLPFSVPVQVPSS